MRPATRDDLLFWLPHVRHAKCSGSVRYNAQVDLYDCVECTAVWVGFAVRKVYTPAEIAASFVVFSAWWLEEIQHVLVEDVSDGKRFLKLVPAGEASKYTKARINA